MDLESKIGEMDKRLKYKDELIEKQAVVLKEISSEVTELKDQVEKQREFSKIAENAADIADRAKESLVEENRKLEVLIEKQVHITEALEDRVETLKEELQTLTAELDQTRSSLNQSRFDSEMQRNMVAGLELKVELRDERIGKIMNFY